MTSPCVAQIHPSRTRNDSAEEDVDEPGSLAELYHEGRIPIRAELERFTESQGWTTQRKNPTGPPMYFDANGALRLTIKRGSPRTAGSEGPHIEIRDEAEQRIDPFGNSVTRRSPDNHFPFQDDPQEQQR